MSNCLSEIIGIRSACTNEVSTRSLFIEDIGITPNDCDSYIDETYKNGSELIKDKIQFAAKIIAGTIRNEFSSKIITKSFIDSKQLGQYQDSLQLKSGDVGLGGVSTTLKNTTSYFDMFVHSISLQLNYAGNVDVFVYDLITGELLDTIVVDCQTNKISTKVVNKSYSSYKRKLDLIFVYDTTSKQSNYTLIHQGCGHCNGYVYNDGYVNAQPVYLDSSSAKIRSSLKGNSHSFGMSINYSVHCSIDKWLCEVSNFMGLPLLYKTGELIMDYALSSKRFNSDTNVDAERNEKRRLAWIEAYNESLAATIRKIQIPKKDPCFICNTPVKNLIITP